MKLSRIKFINKTSQIFLNTGITNNHSNLIVEEILIDHIPSLVAKLKESDMILKCVRARSWHEYLKLLWNHSRISKEVHGNLLLKKLDLSVPEIYQVGIGLFPSSKYEFIGYYIMDNLQLAGFQELSVLITKNLIDAEIRSRIMRDIYSGLKKMRDNNIVFSDFHLGNIFANSTGETAWIDTGVTTYRKFNQNKFYKKYNHSIKRYINYEYEGKQLLSQHEKAIFKKLLITL